MKKPFTLLVSLGLVLSLASCSSNQPESDTAPEPTEDSAIEETVSKTETYADVSALFEPICESAIVSVHLHDIYLEVTMTCPDYSADAEPENWPDIIASLTSALEAGHDLAEQYGVQTVAGVIKLEDETILASGMNGKIAFDYFHHEESSTSQENPPTITKHEYDQIGVGMTLTEVRQIVGGGGELQSQIGTAGVTSITATYRWYGEKESSYADILFDDHKVYSKVELWLE